MSTAPQWTDLETRGFLRLPGFFGAAELATLRADFQQGSSPAEYDLGYKPISANALEVFAARFPQVLEHVSASTSMELDVLLNGMYFATEHVKKTNFWHQDYDAYYRLSRDHVNYLNFYTPIIKPDPSRSNVCLVPFDTLAAASAELGKLLHGAGANFAVQRGDEVIIENPDLRTKVRVHLGRTIESISETPELAAGDLLLIRGDVLHRSQDLQSVRVAASARFGNSRYGYKAETNLNWFRDGRRKP